MSAEIVRHRLEEKVAVIEMDDGKVNAISHSMIEALILKRCQNALRLRRRPISILIEISRFSL